MGAKEYGYPGEWAKIKGTVVSFWPLFPCFALIGAFAASAILGKHVAVFFTLLIAVFAGTVFLWNRGLNKVKSYFLGALGEVRVAAELRKLHGSYHVIHDFQIGRTTFVDHVVMGPTGVFSVETKDWCGELREQEGYIVRNDDIPKYRPPVPQAKSEARKVEKILRKKGWNGTVIPVVCFASNNFKNGPAEIEKVKIVNANEIVALIESMDAAIPPDTIERIVRLTGN